jgi:hypothetical protein
MADIVVHGPILSTPPQQYPWLVDPRAPLRLSPLYAGEALTAGSLCYIDSAGEVKLSFATAAIPGPNVASLFDGVCIENVVDGGPVTLFGLGSVIDLIDGVLSVVAIGDFFYASATPGLISDTAIVTTVAEMPYLKVVSLTAVEVVRTR